MLAIFRFLTITLQQREISAGRLFLGGLAPLKTVNTIPSSLQDLTADLFLRQISCFFQKWSFCFVVCPFIRNFAG
jgi:hypothetical protein